MKEIDCKGREYEEMPLGKAENLTDKIFDRLTAKRRVWPTNGGVKLIGYVNVNVEIKLFQPEQIYQEDILEVVDV